MQERHKALGCTLVMTSNHLITLREDFTAPLRRVNSTTTAMVSPRKVHLESRKLSTSTLTDGFNEVDSYFTLICHFTDCSFIFFSDTLEYQFVNENV